LAQDDPQTPIPEPQLPAPTETIPEQIYPCNPGSYVPSPELGLPDVPPAVDCGELIVPPAGLDPEIEMTPPDPSTGTLRIVPPSDLEPQN
jgi:hypothetical protein